MRNMQQVRAMLDDETFEGKFCRVYCTGQDGLDKQKRRYNKAMDHFLKIFGENDDITVFSAPGRTEVGGNHTDHQHGCVLAAAVNLDVIAIVGRRADQKITVKSEGFDPDYVDADDMTHYPEEAGHSAALIRGVCAAFTQRGYHVGGFDAYTTSNVLKGSGLSSSAAFEVLIGTILNSLYNEGSISPIEIAQIAQYAEREYFGKPCGLMDQMASSVGGFVAIDFGNTEKPIVRSLDFQFADCEHDLVIVDTKGDHTDLTDDYAAITTEMRAVSEFFGKQFLRDVDEDAFYQAIPELREKVGERAVVRAIHFYNDNQLAQTEAEALEHDDFEAFRQMILQSGRSSAMFLQNAYSLKRPTSQGIPLALALTQKILGNQGAWRVHGGGFAGTMQAFVPNKLTELYRKQMDAVFGKGSAHVLSVRPFGAIRML